MIIPLDPIPNQRFSCNINGQNCVFELVMRGVNLFMNLSVNDEVIINGIICLNKVNLIPYNYLDFNGQLYFEDLQGNSDPFYFGLGTRWVLNYVQ